MWDLRLRALVCCCLWLSTSAGLGSAQPSFVNWETPHVHPLDLTPDGQTLLAVNTADHRLQVFDVDAQGVSLRGSVPVGLDPVSVRARTDTEAWVVNHVSDSVSIVDLASMNVAATIHTADEPADVVFAGTPERAFVSCSQANQVLVYDPAAPSTAPSVIAIEGEDPRAMAVSVGGDEVYVAIFESGNATTLVGGGIDPAGEIRYPPDAVGHADGPYGGVNPPPNAGELFDPPMNPENPPPPGAGLIVRRTSTGLWLDDNGSDWSRFISGADASLSGRVEGWDLPDHDLAIIDTTTMEVRYATGLMNACMALAVEPVSGLVTVVGTDAINEVRFEAKLRSQFVRVNAAQVDAAAAAALTVEDLNPHLDYSVPALPLEERQRSLGDPRGATFDANGSRAWVTGMGSSNVVTLDPETGARDDEIEPIPVGAGPTGIVYDAESDRLYVLNKFDASVSVVDPVAGIEIDRVPFYDPTPAAIRDGRPLLYDTHDTSGLGHLSCASCHIDGRMDRLAWDIGNPAGPMISLTDRNLGMGIPPLMEAPFAPYHPMKGPMLTQTLQDIVGKEPLHWRGDLDGIESFAVAYTNLLGREELPSDEQMRQLKEFLASLYFPPNPFRRPDNSLPTDLALGEHYSDGRFIPAGEPLPNGNAVRGLEIFRRTPEGAPACATCHTLTTGMSSDGVLGIDSYQPLPAGPNGEHHHGVTASLSIRTGVTKVPHLRNLYERVGSEATKLTSRAGFGYLHDGGIDSLTRFVSDPSFQPADVQEVADLVAFLLAFSGSDLTDELRFPFEPPGTPSQDTHASVGRQVTIAGAVPPPERVLFRSLLGLAQQGRIGLIAKGVREGATRGYFYVGDGLFQSDRELETITLQALRSGIGVGSELTFTAVPLGAEQRIGVDRDEDGYYDRDELDAGTDPADPKSFPGVIERSAATRSGREPQP